MGPRVILVDGYNTIRNVPALAAVERGSMAAGRDALVQWAVRRYRHTPHRVIIVFDGDGTAESTHPIRAYSRGKIIFTRHGVTADETIIALAARERAAGNEVDVVTDDREVRNSAQRDGASVVRNAQFEAEVNRPPRDLRKRFQHQQAVRTIQEARDSGLGPDRRRGNARKAPKRSRDKRVDERW